MKKLLGFCILVILLVVISGCTQQAQPASATTNQTPIATTVATTEPTPVPTTVDTPPATTIATMETTPVAPNVTTSVSTAIPTPRVSLKPQTKITAISITNNTFTPAELTVLPGTGITWKNDDKVVHTIKVTGKNAGMVKSGDIIPGATWSNTFSKADTYEIIEPTFPLTKCIITVKE